MKRIAAVILTIILSASLFIGCENSELKGKYQSTKETYYSILRVKSGSKFEIIRIANGLTESEARENSTQGSGDIIEGKISLSGTKVTFSFTYWYLDEKREDSTEGTYNPNKKQITVKFFGGSQVYKKI